MRSIVAHSHSFQQQQNTICPQNCICKSAAPRTNNTWSAIFDQPASQYHFEPVQCAHRVPSEDPSDVSSCISFCASRVKHYTFVVLISSSCSSFFLLTINSSTPSNKLSIIGSRFDLRCHSMVHFDDCMCELPKGNIWAKLNGSRMRLVKEKKNRNACDIRGEWWCTRYI